MEETEPTLSTIVGACASLRIDNSSHTGTRVTMALARITIPRIENVFGTSSMTHIWGNASVNTMDGKGGRDYFFYASVGRSER